MLCCCLGMRNHAYAVVQECVSNTMKNIRGRISNELEQLAKKRLF